MSNTLFHYRIIPPRLKYYYLDQGRYSVEHFGSWSQLMLKRSVPVWIAVLILCGCNCFSIGRIPPSYGIGGSLADLAMLIPCSRNCMGNS
jgi:hypothetical protein